MCRGVFDHGQTGGNAIILGVRCLVDAGHSDFGNSRRAVILAIIGNDGHAAQARLIGTGQVDIGDTGDDLLGVDDVESRIGAVRYGDRIGTVIVQFQRVAVDGNRNRHRESGSEGDRLAIDREDFVAALQEAGQCHCQRNDRCVVTVDDSGIVGGDRNSRIRGAVNDHRVAVRGRAIIVQIDDGLNVFA